MNLALREKMTSAVSKKGKRFITIMIIPDDCSERIVSFRLPRVSLSKIAIVPLVLAIVIGVFSLDYRDLRSEVLWRREESKRTRSLIEAQEARLAELSGKVGEAMRHVERLKDIEADLNRTLGRVDFFADVGAADHNTTRASLSFVPSGPSAAFLSGEERTDLENVIDKLLAELPLLAERLAEGKQKLEEKQYELAHRPSIWPVHGIVTTYFNNGRRSEVYIRGLHAGIDIANSPGTPVVATADGVVIYSGDAPYYGKLVMINHDFGIVTVYAHLKEIKIKVGDLVRKGEVIGLLGSTGRSTGPHLHYEVREDGVPVNPLKYLP